MLLDIRSLWEKIVGPAVVVEPSHCTVLREEYAKRGGSWWTNAPKDVAREDSLAGPADSWVMRLRQFFLGAY